MSYHVTSVRPGISRKPKILGRMKSFNLRIKANMFVLKTTEQGITILISSLERVVLEIFE